MYEHRHDPCGGNSGPGGPLPPPPRPVGPVDRIFGTVLIWLAVIATQTAVVINL